MAEPISNRNSILYAIQHLISARGWNNIMICTRLPVNRLRSDRKPVFYLIPRGGANHGEHPILENYVVDVVFVNQSNRDNYGGMALLESNSIREELINQLEIRNTKSGIKFAARVVSTYGPAAISASMPSMQICTLTLGIKSFSLGSAN